MTNPRAYYRPKTLAEAVERAAKPGNLALAGGALILSGLDLPYETIVDLQDLIELRQIAVNDDGLHLGGTATLQSVVETPLVLDVLKRALTRSLPLNIHNGASVGESLIAMQYPPLEWLAALVALNTQVEHAGRLTVPDTNASLWEEPLEEFLRFLHLHQHSYQGIITRIRIPHISLQARFGTAFVARTPADMPIVNVFASVTLNSHNIVTNAVAAVGGASHLPVECMEINPLHGNTPDETQITEAAHWVAANVWPVGNYLGSAEYRVEMTRVLVRRALNDALSGV
jgi:aerobic carbon-monoxide dehydrogenase medium subunit